MIYTSYKSSYDIKESRFELIYKKVFDEVKVKDCQFSLYIVGRCKIRGINNKFRNRDSYTDVIAIEYKDPFYIGDIYICPDEVLKNSLIFGVKFREEMDRVFIHGLLHLLGYDHIDSLNKLEKMYIIQEDILSKL
jgi:probable rRNA maturation factor